MSVVVAPADATRRTAPNKLSADHLTPGDGLARTPVGWRADKGRVTFTAESPLAAGWYRFRLRIRSHDKFTLHKRLEVAFLPADGSDRVVAKDALHWNHTLNTSFVIELPRATSRMTLTLVHADGEFSVERFSIGRIPDSLVGLMAVGEKLRLIAAYRCLGPVLWRGGGMLLRGKFLEFGKKVLKGLQDSRVMRPGEYKASEVDGGWWRRHTLPEAEVESVRAAVDAMPSPPPLAVLLPVNPYKLDEALATAHSVRRQLYPHWELLLACAGPRQLHRQLSSIIGKDVRVKVSLADEDAGLGAAVARSLADAGCERLLVLPPGVELAEDALFRFAEQLQADPQGVAFAAPVYDALASGVRGESTRTADVWLTRTDRLSDDVPRKLNPAALGEWAARGVPDSDRRQVDRVLAYPLQETPLCDRARVGPPPPPPTDRLILAADLNGITGWNHVAYALIRGLPAVGVKLLRHQVAVMDANLVPPNFIPPLRRRTTEAVLAVSPPFLAHRFTPDERTAIYTMWETDTLTPSDVAKLNHAGLVIVPSRWQVECFRRSGVTVPIEVAPLGYDPLVFHDDGSAPEVCTFGTAGALVAGGMRKNAQRMIDLFRQAFPTEQDVRLRVKISPTSPTVDDYDDPRIDLIRATLPYPQLATWYRSLTAYLNGSLGEGFGLHLIEAMACGRPVITANYSGLTAFFDPTVGYVVDHKLVAVSNDIYTGHWAEPDDASLIARMREIHADTDEARQVGQRAASRAANFTWRKSGRKIAAVLRKYGMLPADGEPAV